jgi:hypothetical protein
VSLVKHLPLNKSTKLLGTRSESSPLAGIMRYETKPLFQRIIPTTRAQSCIIDALSDQAIDGNNGQIYAQSRAEDDCIDESLMWRGRVPVDEIFVELFTPFKPSLLPSTGTTNEADIPSVWRSL